MEEGWSIELVRSGGVAGVTRRWSLDSEDLSAEEAAEFERLLAALDDVPAAPPPPGADRFQYELRVTRGGQTRTVTLPEGAIPAGLRPLIDRPTRPCRAAYGGVSWGISSSRSIASSSACAGVGARVPAASASRIPRRRTSRSPRAVPVHPTVSRRRV